MDDCNVKCELNLMKVLLQAYYTSFQNIAGGVHMRIDNLMDHLAENGIHAKMFDLWTDYIKDYDIIHFFKLNMSPLRKVFGDLYNCKSVKYCFTHSLFISFQYIQNTAIHVC